MESRAPRLVLFFLLLVGCSTGCNSGIGAIVAATSGSSGDANTATTISAFTVESAKLSPATVRFRLTDDDGDSAQVALFFQTTGGFKRPLTALAGASNPASYTASGGGTEHTLTWDFSAEPDLPSSGSFEQDVQVWAELTGDDSVVVGVNAVELGLGNDAPLVSSIAPPDGESDGVVPVEFTVSDTSADLVDVRVEFQDAVGSWQLARPASLDATPELAFENLLATEEGAVIVFFWDTDVDLTTFDGDVRLRFTAIDSVAEGVPAESPLFQVDNNEEPILLIQESLFTSQGDERGGIVVPFRVLDEEGDTVEAVFQWRMVGESFPDLPTDLVELEAILGDPELRREMQIATEAASYLSGQIAVIDEDSLRLPDLVTGPFAVMADRLVGSELELVRPRAPRTIAWDPSPLSSPVSAIPVRDSTTAYVLDSDAGGWRVREIELATGSVLATVATGPGSPTAMSLDSTGRHLFVAAGMGTWMVERFEVVSGVATPAGSVSGSSSSGSGIRGLAVLGSDAAVVTVDDAIRRVDFRGPGSASTLFQGLSEPWGIAVDHAIPGLAYAALHGESRVVELDLVKRLLRDLPALPPYGALAFPNPRDLAMKADGTRLFVATRTNGVSPTRGLRILPLRSTASFDADPAAEPQVVEYVEGFPDDLAGIETGPESLLIAALPNADALVIGGGIEQRRTITDYLPHLQEATVDAPFQPTPRNGQVWRVDRATQPTPTIESRRFVWDSSDLPLGGEVHLRAFPIDAELGIGDETSSPKVVASPWGDGLPVTSPVSNTIKFIDFADLDGDGDLDLVQAERDENRIALYFQTGRRTFNATPTLIGDASNMLRPTSPLAVDLDGDGDNDIVVATNEGVRAITQVSPGVFDPNPVLIGAFFGSPFFFGPEYEIADLDGDGAPDLVMSAFDPDEIWIYYQSSPGVFDPVPTALAAPPPLYFDVADLDDNGLLDIIVTGDPVPGTPSPPTQLLQTSPGTFESSVIGVDTSAAQSIGDALVADIDRDGALDLTLPDLLDDQILIVPQSETGLFDQEPWTLRDPLTSFGGIQWHTVADLDRNGLVDVLAITFGLFCFYQADPDSFLQDPVRVEGLEASSASKVADVDGDGHLDIGGPHPGESTEVFFQGVDAQFDSDPLELEMDPGLTPTSIQAADMDSDGALDLVVTMQPLRGVLAPVQTSIFRQAGAGTFEVAQKVIVGEIGEEEFISSRPADLDGDGDMDLVLRKGDQMGFLVYEQSSEGIFEKQPVEPVVPPGFSSFTSFDVADLDSDGDLDLVAALALNDRVGVWFQGESGGFEALPLLITVDSPTSVRAADMNEDGLQDVVAGTFDNFTILYQLGTGGFDPTPEVIALPPFNTPNQFLAEDLDGDADTDLFMINSSLEAVTLFRQESGGFVTSFAIPFNLGPARLAAAGDVDGNGLKDIHLSTSSQQNAVLYQRAPGRFDTDSPEFGEHTAGIPSTRRGTMADLDGDGDLDVVAPETDRVFVYWNQD